MFNEAVEFVLWDYPKIEHTAMKLVGFYTMALPQLGTNRWARFAIADLLPTLKGRSAKPVKLDGHGFALAYHPPYSENFISIHDGDPSWQSNEPAFIFYDHTSRRLSPQFRTLLYKTNNAIAQEVESVYKLVISENPFRFNFPKDEYAEVRKFNGVVITGN